MHIKESAPLLLCNALFGKDSLVQGSIWQVVDPLVIALPVAVIVLVVVNFFGKKLPDDHLDRCFQDIKS
ncbi:MAG: hypothetical protein U5R06_20590 [candidate division KSB1 bacterium]|nr:hypothetical protein [candidate division KSB1 bacterium]